jgi:hypothetical protein
MDFFVVPTVTCRLLYVLVVMNHERRRIVHFNITDAPTAGWTAQQIINAFPYDTAASALLRNHVNSVLTPTTLQAERTLRIRMRRDN